MKNLGGVLRKSYFILVLIVLTNIVYAITVDGNAFLENQTDHSGIVYRILFIPILVVFIQVILKLEFIILLIQKKIILTNT